MMDETDIVFVVLYSVFSVLVLFSNSIVIIVIIKSRELHLPTLWNIAFMAAWDLAFGLHFLVFIVPSKIVNAFVYPNIYGGFASKLLMFIVIQNVINIMIVLVDRYIAICWPLHYNQIVTPKRFIFTVIGAVLVSLLRLCIFLTTTKTDGVYNKALGYFTASNVNIRMSVSAVFSLIIWSIIIALLIRIRLELSRAQSTIGRQQGRSPQFTYTMYVSTIVYIVLFLPSAVSLLISLVLGKTSEVLSQVGMVCVLSNSLWNVFIYAGTYQPFRDAFLKLFCPNFFRERARREVQVHFQNNRVSMITVDEHN